MYSSTFSLASALDGVGGQRHTLAALSPDKRLVTHYIGGWLGTRSYLNGCGKSHPHRESNSGQSSRVQRVAIPTELSRLTTECIYIYIYIYIPAHNGVCV